MKTKNKSMLAQLKYELPCDQVSKLKDGAFIARRGFFYRMGMDSEQFKAKIERALTTFFNGKKSMFTITDYGEHWAASRGGSSLARSSHWYVKFKINEEETPLDIE